MRRHRSTQCRSKPMICALLRNTPGQFNMSRDARPRLLPRELAGRATPAPERRRGRERGLSLSTPLLLLAALQLGGAGVASRAMRGGRLHVAPRLARGGGHAGAWGAHSAARMVLTGPPAAPPGVQLDPTDRNAITKERPLKVRARARRTGRGGGCTSERARAAGWRRRQVARERSSGASCMVVGYGRAGGSTKGNEASRGRGQDGANGWRGSAGFRRFGRASARAARPVSVRRPRRRAAPAVSGELRARLAL